MDGSDRAERHSLNNLFQFWNRERDISKFVLVNTVSGWHWNVFWIIVLQNGDQFGNKCLREFIYFVVRISIVIDLVILMRQKECRSIPDVTYLLEAAPEATTLWTFTKSDPPFWIQNRPCEVCVVSETEQWYASRMEGLTSFVNDDSDVENRRNLHCWTDMGGDDGGGGGGVLENNELRSYLGESFVAGSLVKWSAWNRVIGFGIYVTPYPHERTDLKMERRRIYRRS